MRGLRTPFPPGVRICLAPFALLAVVVFLAVSSGDARAANTRVSISDFAWSGDPSIDLGESVTWDWLGPDTAHSITGIGPGGVRIDSDPGTSFPRHAPGDEFTVSFGEPGRFTFVCKLHSSVRGAVTVSETPGDPDSDPGPQPPVFFDGRSPDLREVRLASTRIGPRGKGVRLRFAVDERATADADYFRVGRKGRKVTRTFVGFSKWRTFIGYNAVRFGARTKRFRAKPGRYVALLRVTDPAGNATRPVTLVFEIAGPGRRGRSAGQSSG